MNKPKKQTKISKKKKKKNVKYTLDNDGKIGVIRDQRERMREMRE